MKTVPVMLLVGPRQCGKTTLVKSIAQSSEMGYVSCDQMNTLASINFDPVRFVREQKTGYRRRNSTCARVVFAY